MPGTSLTLGREGDVVIDDNPFLHRRFLEIHTHDGLWWIANVGNHLTATVADPTGGLNAWLSPGARMPIVFRETSVWFTAGPTTYDFEIRYEGGVFAPPAQVGSDIGGTTIGRVSFTPDQRLLVVALCEKALLKGEPGGSSIPQSAEAAARLGWTVTRFNRKLDNVCQKLTAGGVSGLHGSSDRLASSRRARLVEYALASRLERAMDSGMLRRADPFAVAVSVWATCHGLVSLELKDVAPQGIDWSDTYDRTLDALIDGLA